LYLVVDTLLARACWRDSTREENVRRSLKIVVVVIVGLSAMSAQEPSPRRSVWDRVFTDAQASRGETLYGRHCEQCHGAGLDGDAATEVPALVGDTFLQRWSGRTVDDLFVRMARSMPQLTPGSLSRAEYADLTAFLLRANSFPAGFEALGTDSERLKAVAIERRAP
jgi:hypothetical protein